MLAGMTKDQIAEILTDIATLLEFKGENPFKSRAYVNAARSLEGTSEPPGEHLRRRIRPTRIKGIGDSLHDKIAELLANGQAGLLRGA